MMDNLNEGQIKIKDNMLLSILIPGKNDSFRENNTKTIELNLQKTISNLERLGKSDVEVVLCDWGSEVKIIESVFEQKHKNFKCVYVPPHIAKKYNGVANYSIVHPINVAVRKSSGKYVVFWDSDCFVPYDTFEKLYQFVCKMNNENDMSFYWASRHNIESENYTHCSTHSEVDDYLNNNPVLKHDKILDEFMGCSIALLMNRSLWESSTGFWEKLIYWGWQDIEFHRRLCFRYKYGGDLESHGMRFFHLSQKIHQRHIANPTIANPQIDCMVFEANPQFWGLENEVLELL